MIVNLFDSNFSETQSCSVLGQTSTYINYIQRQMAFDGVTLFTDEWINNPVVDEVKSKYKVGWLHEPYCLHPDTYERTLSNLHKFDFIFTYFQPFLDEYPDKFKLCSYMGTWIDSLDWGIKPKSKLCSMLIGSKMSTEGHRIRHEIAEMIEDTGLEVDFYGTKGTPVGYGQETKLTILEDYYFSLAIETCREENLFSEWLTDCMALGTIPIFWGAPNIQRFFKGGIILPFDTVDRVEKILRQISFEMWIKNLPKIYENLLNMQEYAVTEDWLYLNALKELE